MQHSRNDCYDAVVHQFAKDHCCLLKGIGTMQSGALGLILQQPLPVTQLEGQLQKGIRSPLQKNAQSEQTQNDLIQAETICSHSECTQPDICTSLVMQQCTAKQGHWSNKPMLSKKVPAEPAIRICNKLLLSLKGISDQ